MTGATPVQSGMTDQPPGASYVLTCAQTRRLDALAVEAFGIPSMVLMENAARALAAVARSMLRDADTRRVVILAGPGNNGGDGLAAARHLHNAGGDVRICLAADPDRVKGDAATNLAIVRSMGLSLRVVDAGDPARSVDEAMDGWAPPGLVIDALLGTGLTHPPRPPISTLIARINDLGESGWGVVSADVPSGLDADTGQAAGAVVRADATVTFAALKPAFRVEAAGRFTGRVNVGDIGAPRELLERLGTRV